MLYDGIQNFLHIHMIFNFQYTRVSSGVIYSVFPNFICNCRSSSVIKIVKMKYNRINIKWCLVSTSFKIYLDILSNFYITFTIFYYNIISLKCTLCPVLVKGLYQTESYSLHVMQLIRI